VRPNQRGGLTGGCFGNSSILGGHSSKADSYHFAGDIHAWISRGYLKESAILERLHGTVSEVITGRKPGRENAHEKILVIVQGMASCDLALARFIYDKLRDSEEVQRLAMNDSPR